MAASRIQTDSIQIRVCPDDFSIASDYIRSLLDKARVSSESIRETMLVYEALVNELLEQGYDESTIIDLSGNAKSGDVSINLVFNGDMFVPTEGSVDSPEGLILEGYSDRIAHHYFRGQNTISITVKRSYRNSLFQCAIAVLLALVVFIPFALATDDAARKNILENYIMPFEKLFANAMLMIGAPMTFFSLVKNLTSTYVISERYSGLRQLSMRTIATSTLAIVLATLVAFLFEFLATIGTNQEFVQPATGLDTLVSKVTEDLLPSNIFDAFGAISPIPLFIVALLVTYSLCRTGKYFTPLKNATDACFALVSRMLNAVMALLPLFCFIATLNILFSIGLMGYHFLIAIVVILVGSIISLIPLFITYALRVRACGTEILPFIKTLIPLVSENYKIGSVIEATQFNIRYSARHFGLSRSLLEKNMPVLAQINLDGNAALIMFLSLASIFALDVSFSWVNIVGIGLLVLFLSLGAPNQPGSLLIGMLIVYSYLDISEMIALVIFIEAFLGPVQNGINVIGDIVLAVELDSAEHE